MRNLIKVIDEMLEVIPDTETDLIAQLRSVQKSARYAAPEMAGYWWRIGEDALMRTVPNPTDGWQKRMAAIWNDYL